MIRVYLIAVQSAASAQQALDTTYQGTTGGNGGSNEGVYTQMEELAFSRDWECSVFY